MKSSIKVLVALLLVLGMALPAMAEDRLKLSGSLQVRGQIYNVDEDGGLDDTYAWNDMRMRIGGKIAVADGVSVNFRFDTSESAENSSDPLAWGADNQYSARRADIQFDKAYLEIQKYGFTLQAGELYFGGFSPTQSIMDFTAPGFIVKYGDLTVAHATRFDENVGKDTFGIGHTGDSTQTAAIYKLKGEGFTFSPAIGYNADDSAAENTLLGIALAGTVDLGPVALKGELDYFDGEANTYKGTTFGTKQDLKGLQLMLDGSMAATDAIRVGVVGLYAAEQDGTNEIQAYNMADDSVADWGFVDYNPQHYGSYASDFVYTDKFSIWDPAGTSSGVMAGQIYADVKASDTVDLKFAGMYFTVADDAIVDLDGFSLDAQVAYKVMANTSLVSHLNYMSAEDNDSSEEFKYLGIITGLTVTF